MAPESSPIKYGRGRREIKKNVRFESLEIPGINSAPNLVRPKQARNLLNSPSNSPTHRSRHADSCEQQATKTTSNDKSDQHNSRKMRKVTKGKAETVANASSQPSQANDGPSDMTATMQNTPESHGTMAIASASASQNARKKKSAAQRKRLAQSSSAAVPRSRTLPQRSKSGIAKSMPTPAPSSGVDLSVPFTHEKLRIYNWPYPHPTNFPNISQSQRDWKEKADATEAAADIDDGINDWHGLSGRRESYTLVSMEYSIASSWVKHAKRAFWTGKSWRQFETEQRAIDSEAMAKGIPDPEKRKVELSWALSNKFRLGIFELLKVRLCREIWLEEYVELPIVEDKEKKDSLGDVFTSIAPQAKARPAPEADGVGDSSVDHDDTMDMETNESEDD